MPPFVLMLFGMLLFVCFATSGATMLYELLKIVYEPAASGLHRLNYIQESQGLTHDLLFALSAIRGADIQNCLSVAVVWILYSSLKPRNESALFRGIDDERLQPDQHLKRNFKSWWNKPMPRGSVADLSMADNSIPSGVLFAPGAAYVRPRVSVLVQHSSISIPASVSSETSYCARQGRS
mmetsp:Transcript_15060/g.36768  ORF Transcript_15060/g.36768 Transcript_15060/m.36768 type:complete len:180 (-) Transcript_15060:5420-5959(-)